MFAKTAGRIYMRRFGLVCLFVAVCSPVSGNVLLTIPSRIVPPNLSANNASTFSLDLGLTVPSGSQALVSYDLSLQVTGGSGLSITGTEVVFRQTPSSPLPRAFRWKPIPTVRHALLFRRLLVLGGDHHRQQQPAPRGLSGTGNDQRDVPHRCLGECIRSADTVFYSGVTSSGGLVTINGWTQQDASLSIALPGDAELNGKVDVNDLTIVLAHYGQTGMSWTTGDFQGDGKVDVNDLTIVLRAMAKAWGCRPQWRPCPSPRPC